MWPEFFSLFFYLFQTIEATLGYRRWAPDTIMRLFILCESSAERFSKLWPSSEVAVCVDPAPLWHQPFTHIAAVHVSETGHVGLFFCMCIWRNTDIWKVVQYLCHKMRFFSPNIKYNSLKCRLPAAFFFLSVLYLMHCFLPYNLLDFFLLNCCPLLHYCVLTNLCSSHSSVSSSNCLHIFSALTISLIFICPRSSCLNT